VGTSENNWRARFYRLTRAGEKLLEAEKRDWEQTAAIIARFFEVKVQGFRHGHKKTTDLLRRSS